MKLVRKVLGPQYDTRVLRHKMRQGKPELIWDKAAEVEDGTTEEKMIEFKSDKERVPKPSEELYGNLWFKKWHHMLLLRFKPKRKKFLEVVDNGDGDARFVQVREDDVDFQGEHMFETHRNMMGKKTLELFSQDDNTKLWMAGYLTALAFITVGAMYVTVTGVKSSVADSVKAGVEAGLSSANSAQQTTENVPSSNIIPVLGFTTLQAASKIRAKVSSLLP